MNITIRKATLYDAEAIASLYLQFWEVHGAIDPLCELAENPTLDNQLEGARKAIRRKKTHILVGVEKETNEVMGYIEFLIKKNESCFKIKEYGYLDACVTDKKHRRKGVAQKPTKAALNFLKNRGITYVKTNVYNINEPGRKVLQKLGFEDLSTLMIKMI